MLEAIDLRKSYGKLKAVDGVSFAVSPGTCFGLLGPNGAGKTTTIEMMEGIVQPTGGEVRYKGELLGPRFKEEVGIMFQATALQEYITVKECLAMFSRLYRKSIDPSMLIEKCALGDFLGQDNKKISGGQKQRLLLAIALINDPSVVFLDEPTTGLDPQARRALWKLVNEIKEAGKTIILTTHYMEEAYQLSDEIAIMNKGRIIAQGGPDFLLKKHFNDTVIEIPMADFHAGASLGIDWIESGGYCHINASNVSDVLRELLKHNVNLERMRLRAKSLEDLFLELTGKEQEL